MRRMFAVFAAVLPLLSCSEQQVKDSGSVAASTLCHSLRNCTVQDQDSP